MATGSPENLLILFPNFIILGHFENHAVARLAKSIREVFILQLMLFCQVWPLAELKFPAKIVSDGGALRPGRDLVRGKRRLLTYSALRLG